MTGERRAPRLGVDIGGTFTDLALDLGERRLARKLLTTPTAPEHAVIEGVSAILADAGIAPRDLGLVIHGTTLATNAIIERKGARTALIVTEGFRDSVEMAYENRFDQYDINVERPPPLVPRYLRWPVRERISARGQIWTPLDERAVEGLVARIEAEGIESLAVGLLHAYANPVHERRVAAILKSVLPDLWITLSSEVCPEIREYERLSTACANAYVQPLMAGYLTALDARLRDLGVGCPLFLMMSSGGLTTIETATRFPIRLVDSGPAGGAILAARVAAECAASEVLSFDMGGTTAKICLIDDGVPQSARSYEIARAYRYAKGSGLPLRIPVIEMVEIGAGGGSIARVDGLRRLHVGPESAGAEPGPACYGRGGWAATVTDADVLLGRIDPAAFAGGAVTLTPASAAEVLDRAVGEPLGLAGPRAAQAVSEIVDENMANAARVHAVERGRDMAGRVLVAFGGAAPLHAARLAEKLEIETILVPTGAGVGSAIGFLRAPLAYQVVRSRFMRLSAFDAGAVNAMLDEMRGEAHRVVRLGAPKGELIETRTADMRYAGQGHEITVPIPSRAFDAGDAARLQAAFDEGYRAQYGRRIPGVDVEILSWTVAVTTPVEHSEAVSPPDPRPAPAPNGRRAVYDGAAGEAEDYALYARASLAPGMAIDGPALIVEAQTTTLIPRGFAARINALGYIVIERKRRGRANP